MTNEHDMYLTTAIMNKIQERISKTQESLIKVLKDRPDDIKSIEIHETIIRELRSILK